MTTVKQILSQAFSACCSCDTSCPLKVFFPPRHNLAYSLEVELVR